MIKGRLGKILILLIVSILMFNFISSNVVMGTSNTGNEQTITEAPPTAGVVGNSGGIMDEIDIAETISDGASLVADGLVGIFTYFERIKIIIIGGVLQFLGTVVGESAGTSNSGTLTVITPEDILFNRLAITDINFFNLSSFGTGDHQQSLSGSDNPIRSLKQSVANWYMTLRTMAIIVLLCVLIYIGIRMVMASSPETKSNYKKVLVNWVVSLAMVFLLHYIILIALNINNVFVDMISSVKDNALPGSNATFFGSYLGALVQQSFYPLATISWSSAIVYLCIVALTFIFLIMYIKRMITIAFLILISPIITITYSIDKAGDGRAQALSAWIKEFLHNVFIQPFHCLIYVAFVAIAMNILQGEGTLASAVLVIVTMFFILQAEDLIKKIFGIDSKSTGSALATAAVLSAAYGKLPSGGKKAPSNVGKGPTGTNANSKGQASSLVASNNIAASNVQETSNEGATRSNLSSEELSRKLSGGAGEDIDYRNLRSFDQDAKRRAEQERMEAENRRYSAMASDYNSLMTGEEIKGNAQSGTTSNDNMKANASNGNQAGRDIPYVEMPEVKNDNNSDLYRAASKTAGLAKTAGRVFVEGNKKTSGLAGASMGASLAGLGGADIGNVFASMAVGKKVQNYIEDGASSYAQKVNKLEEYIKESNIKNNERVLATAFSNHKHGEEYNRDADIQKARDYLGMDSNKIKDIKETSERQYVQSLHAMRSIYNQNYDDDPNEKVIETMGKIIDKDIKPND